MINMIAILLSTLIMNKTTDQQLSVDSFPGHFDHATLIFHPSTQSLLLSGFPLISDSIQNDVWSWSGKSWNKISASGPGNRYFFYGTFDSKQKNVFHFGGNKTVGHSFSHGDLWKFNGEQWSKQITNDIGKRHHHRIVYADHLDALVLYGGFNAHDQPDTTTWIFRDGKFSSLNITGPGIRYHSGMTYDKNRNKVVLYGGGDEADELWEFDGKLWGQTKTSLSPGKKFHHQMVYDENLKAVILHGGRVNLNSRDPENFKIQVTWMWNGTNWTKIAEASIFPIAMAYYPPRKSVIVYGYDQGNPDASRNIGMWELRNRQWTQLENYGEWSAVAFLKDQHENDQRNQNILFAYANALKSAGNFGEAELMFEKLLEIGSQPKETLSAFIETLILQGKASEADQIIESNSSLKRELYIHAAENFHRIARYEFAIDYYEKALAMQPGAQVYYNLGCVSALSGNYTKAFDALNKAVALGLNKRTTYERDIDLKMLHMDLRWRELEKKFKD